MTLVEVIGGLALLATLLVAMLLAKGRYTRQAATADRRLQAVAAADALLTGWHQDATSLSGARAGVVPGDAGLAWRTLVVPNAAINALDARVVRLEIVDNRPHAALNPVLTSVEFVIDADAPHAVPITRDPTAKRPAHNKK
jgi:hypothetical protein